MLKKIMILLLASVVLTACGEKSKDDKIEEAALPLYKKLVEEKSYCKALEVTRKRFDYAIDYQTSNEELAKRALKWEKRAQEIVLDCAKEQWPQKEALLLKAIKEKQEQIEKYEDLMKFVAVIPANSFGQDELQRHCTYDLSVNNGSSVSLMGFSYEVTSPVDLNYGGKADYQMREGYAKEEQYRAFAPGEQRTVKVCDFTLGGRDSELRRTGTGSIPVNVRVIELESRERIELFRYKKKEAGFDFATQIEVLKKRLDSENPNKR